MKQIISIVLLLIMLLSLVSCGKITNISDAVTTPGTENTGTQTREPTNSSPEPTNPTSAGNLPDGEKDDHPEPPPVFSPVPEASPPIPPLNFPPKSDEITVSSEAVA